MKGSQRYHYCYGYAYLFAGFVVFREGLRNTMALGGNFAKIHIFYFQITFVL